MFSGVRKCGKAEPAQPIQEKTERLKEVLWQADAVLMGAGAGLSTSAGFTYSTSKRKLLYHNKWTKATELRNRRKGKIKADVFYKGKEHTAYLSHNLHV